MKIEEVIAAVKEFFLEFIGFLLPGFILILLTYAFIRNDLRLAILSTWPKEYMSTQVLVASYVVGYVLYGASLVHDLFVHWMLKILRGLGVKTKKTFIQAVYDEIEQSIEYETTLRILHKKLGIRKKELHKLPVNNVRNIAMSYVPEADKKIYNFTFRAELSEKVGTAFKIIFLLGVLSFIFEKMNPDYKVLNTDRWALLSYALMLVATYFLGYTKRRFVRISTKLIFPIFLVQSKSSPGTKGKDEGR